MVVTSPSHVPAVTEEQAARDTWTLVRGLEKRDALGELVRQLVRSRSVEQVESHHAELVIDDATSGVNWTLADDLRDWMSNVEVSEQRRRVLAAFIAIGIERALFGASDEAKTERATPILHELVEDELGGIPVGAFVAHALSSDHLLLILKATRDVALECAHRGTRDGVMRAVFFMRFLQSAGGPTGRVLIEALVGELEDSALRAFARVLVSPRSSGFVDIANTRILARLDGWVSRRMPRGFLRLLRIASGWTVFVWVTRFLGSLVGFGRRGEVILRPTEIALTLETRFLGRSIRKRESRYPTSSILGVVQDTKLASWHLALGLLAIALGWLAGGYLLLDAYRTGNSELYRQGAMLVVVSALFDFVLDVLVPVTAKRVNVEVWISKNHYVCLRGVLREDADRFMSLLGQQF